MLSYTSVLIFFPVNLHYFSSIASCKQMTRELIPFLFLHAHLLNENQTKNNTTTTTEKKHGTTKQKQIEMSQNKKRALFRVFFFRFHIFFHKIKRVLLFLSFFPFTSSIRPGHPTQRGSFRHCSSREFAFAVATRRRRCRCRAAGGGA